MAAGALAAAAMALAAACFLASCSRPSNAKAAAKQIPANPTGASQPGQPQTGVAPAPPLAAGKPQPVAALSPPLAASLRAFGLGARPLPRIAEDFSLGPLQSYRPAKGDEEDALKTALSFMDGISQGRLDKGLLLPEAREALSVLLAPPGPAKEAQTARPYRLGAIELLGQGASLRVRMPGAASEARVEGLLSLRKSGGSWFVEGLSLDPPASAELVFNPDTSARQR
jgi:hypothetical protein